MERYESFRRSRFKKADMRKVHVFCIFSVHFPLFSWVSFLGLYQVELLAALETLFLSLQNLLVPPIFVI